MITYIYKTTMYSNISRWYNTKHLQSKEAGEAHDIDNV